MLKRYDVMIATIIVANMSFRENPRTLEAWTP
jgi:hypothetical protein